MDELLEFVEEKTGLSTDQARGAVDAVVDFIEQKAPGVGAQIRGFIEGGGEASGFMDKITGMFGSDKS